MIKRFTFFRGGLLVSLSLALLGGPGCHRHTGSTPFPASNDITGWTRTGEIRTFAAADLWKYIDGDAERYLKAGLKTTSTTDYKFGNRIDAVVDIYTMETAAGAEQILKSEPAGEAKFIQLGEDARLYSGSLIFCKGPYLVRITAYQNSPEAQQALVALGRGIEQRLAK